MSGSPGAVVLLCLTLFATPSAAAQDVVDAPAVVETAAPIYLLPDATRTPLRTLAAGTALVLLQRQGEWVQVTFEDRNLGQRTGWIESRFVRVRAALPGLTPDPVPEDPAATAASPPARAGARRAPAGRPRATTAPGFRVFGGVTFERMAASESFKAITGSDVVRSYGGGLQITNLWRGLFVEASAARASVDGERVFVFGDEVFPLGIPLAISMTPLDVVAGWRAPVGRVTPYVGGGMAVVWYKETSDFADADENIDERFRGFVVMGGAEVRLARWVHLRGDVRYRRVNDAFGVGGVSAQFDEKTLGGLGTGVHLIIGR